LRGYQEGVVLGGKKQNKLTGKLRSILLEEVTTDLEVYDLQDWQKACRGFGPVHLEKQTRKEWFQDNKSRIPVTREIVEFIKSWKTKYQGDDRFSEIRVTAIVKELIEVVRKLQKKEGMKLGLLNVVKLAGFRTLVKWADSPSEFKKRIAPRKKQTPEKKIYVPPTVEFVRNAEIEGDDRLLLTIAIVNSGRTPYQNVEFELELDSNLSVLSVEQFTWSPIYSRIRIGFIESSLGTGSKECVLKVHLAMTKKRPKYKIGGKIIYDDYENAKRMETQVESVLIEV
jgi:hypothetical protein